MYYPDYLIHYNKNHSAKNGQFTSGDGDGDGISNDHAHRSKKDGGRKTSASDHAKNKKIYNSGKALLYTSLGTSALTIGLSAIADETGSAVARGASWVSALADAAVFSVGTANYLRGRARLRNEK